MRLSISIATPISRLTKPLGAVNRMYFDWHPTVVHDLHEGMPMMMSWNGTGPYNPNVDPITYTEFLELELP